jgi:hypothetical protein
VELNITNAKKPFTIAEVLSVLCVVDACAKHSEESYAEAIKNIQFSNDTINWRMLMSLGNFN